MAEFRRYISVILMIIVVFGVIPVVFAIGWMVYVLYNVKIVVKKKISPSGERESYAARKRFIKAKRFLKFQVKIAKGFFGDAIVNWRDGEGGTMELMIHKYRFPIWTLAFVIINEAMLVAFTLATFFLLLLIERSYVCDPTATGVDCFPSLPIRNSTMFYPLLNCSDYMYEYLGTIDDVQCYKFGFNFASAAGLAGGMLEILPLFFIVVTLVILKVASGHKLRKYTTALLQVLVLLICFSFLLVLTREGNVNDYLIADDNENYLTYACMVGIMFAGVSMPWVFLLRGKHHDDSVNNEDDNELEGERIEQLQATAPLPPVDNMMTDIYGINNKDELTTTYDTEL